MLNLKQIRSVVAENKDCSVFPDDLGASKQFILVLDDVEGMKTELNQIKSYAPYWSLSENILVTGKMVYASVLIFVSM